MYQNAIFKYTSGYLNWNLEEKLANSSDIRVVKGGWLPVKIAA